MRGERGEVIGIVLDSKTKDLLDKYGKERSLSRSAVIRFICNEFFLKEK